jgi:hypothetical protein
LIKRRRRHQNDLFTFLKKGGVPFDDNHAERSIRLAVIIRKNSYGNRSEQGSDCQATLMSIFRTLKQCGHDPIRTIISATQDYVKSSKLHLCHKKTLHSAEVLLNTLFGGPGTFTFHFLVNVPDLRFAIFAT